MKKKIIILSLTFCLLLTSVFAHSGRTDSSGGHRDNKNVSGLGYYHYHCGGNPPHLHSNGVCPYSTYRQSYTPTIPKTTYNAYTSQTTNTSSSNKISVSKPSFPVKVNNSSISNYSDKWSPFVYNDIVYVPMTYNLANALQLKVEFDENNGCNLQHTPNEKESFLDNKIAIVSKNGSNLYHKYGCSDINLNSFWAFDVDSAVSNGFVKCTKCH